MVRLEWSRRIEKQVITCPAIRSFHGDASEGDETPVPTVVVKQKIVQVPKRKRLKTLEAIQKDTLEDTEEDKTAIPPPLNNHFVKEPHEKLESVESNRILHADSVSLLDNSFPEKMKENEATVDVKEEQSSGDDKPNSCSKDSPHIAETGQSISQGGNMKLSSPLLNPIKNTLWQRLVSANEKREKQLAKKGFSPAGFVIDSVHDLKTSLSIELFDHGFTKDSRKILLPYDCHARSFLRSLELGLLPCYEELPENHTFHYYQGCLIAEIRDYRLSFRGFLNTNVKASHKSSPVTYKVVLRPDAQIICSDIDRTIEKVQNNVKIESDIFIQLESRLLLTLFRKIHWNASLPRFKHVWRADSTKWNILRRPRMITKTREIQHGMRNKKVHGWRHRSVASLLLYVLTVIQSQYQKEQKAIMTKTTDKGKLPVRKPEDKIEDAYRLIGKERRPHGLCLKPLPNDARKRFDEFRSFLYPFKKTLHLSTQTQIFSSNRATCFTPSRLRPDIIRILAFSYNRLLPTKGRSVHCSLQVGRKDNLSFYCESRKTCFRDASIDKNSFITNSLENAMDFADNFRRICEFEGYICILDSLRGPFERSTESVVDSAMDRNTKRNNAPSTSVHVGMPSGIMNNNPNTTGAVQKLPNYPPNVALAQPAWRQTGQPSLRDGGTTLPSSYGKSIRLGETPNTSLPQGSFYQGMRSDNTQLEWRNNSFSAAVPNSAQNAQIIRGPRPLKANRVPSNTSGMAKNENVSLSTAKKMNSSPVHSSTSSFR
eukprot:jgi/Galph1/4263/GphlegSOOS_G2923.1